MATLSNGLVHFLMTHQGLNMRRVQHLAILRRDNSSSLILMTKQSPANLQESFLQASNHVLCITLTLGAAARPLKFLFQMSGSSKMHLF